MPDKIENARIILERTLLIPVRWIDAKYVLDRLGDLLERDAAEQRNEADAAGQAAAKKIDPDERPAPIIHNHF